MSILSRFIEAASSSSFVQINTGAKSPFDVLYLTAMTVADVEEITDVIKDAENKDHARKIACKVLPKAFIYEKNEEGKEVKVNLVSPGEDITNAVSGMPVSLVFSIFTAVTAKVESEIKATDFLAVNQPNEKAVAEV